MKIGMILDAPFPPDPRVENEAVFLIQQGHDIHLFCFDYQHDAKHYEVIKGIHVHRHKVGKVIYKLSALAYTLPWYHALVKPAIRQFIKRTGVEALHIHDMAIARPVIQLAKAFNLPSVLDLHEMRPEIMKFYPHVYNAPGKYLISPDRWEHFESLYVREADKVVVVTEEAKVYYEEKLDEPEEKFAVVPNTVRKEFYEKAKIDTQLTARYANNFTLLYVGETGLRRGLITAIKAIALLKQSIPNIKLVIVGKSRTDVILHQKINDLSLSDYIDMEGWQPFEKFQSYIAAADVGISPIHRNKHHNTTFANKIFQYMSFGKPILVSNSDAQEHVVRESNCGLVFEDQNANDFATQILRLYQNKKLYDELSANAKQAIETQYRWDLQARSLKKLYQELA